MLSDHDSSQFRGSGSKFDLQLELELQEAERKEYELIEKTRLLVLWHSMAAIVDEIRIEIRQEVLKKQAELKSAAVIFDEQIALIISSILQLQFEEERRREEAKRKRVANILEAGGIAKLFFRIASVITGALKVAHDAIGAISQIIPPLNAAVTGMITIVELIEAIFLSRESRGSKGVKVATSTIGSGLSIYAAVLTLNPVTAPLGAALLAASMTVTVLRDVFYVIKLSQDIDDPQKLDKLAENIKAFQERKRSLFSNSLALAGTIFMAVMASAVVGALVMNPVGIGVIGTIGVALLSFSVVSGVYNFYKKHADFFENNGMTETEKSETQKSVEPNRKRNKLDHGLSNIMRSLFGKEKGTKATKDMVHDLHIELEGVEPAAIRDRADAHSQAPVISRDSENETEGREKENFPRHSN